MDQDRSPQTTDPSISLPPNPDGGGPLWLTAAKPVRFGSADSRDVDHLYMVDQLPGPQDCKRFCSGNADNRNLVVVKEGVLAETYKGLPDETNNALLATYGLHPQAAENPVTRPVTRIAPLKVVRATRIVLSHLSRTAHRAEVKRSLDSMNLEQRLLTLAGIDFRALDLPPDALKSVAFQLVQTNALIDGLELYTKQALRDHRPRAADLLGRAPGPLDPLNDLRDELLQKVGGVYVRQKGTLNLLMYGNALAIDEWNLYARQCRGVVIDMARERCVCFPMDKFFRFGEGPEVTRERLDPATPVEVVEKLDGSMVSLVEHEGRRQFCCKGNFDTPQTERAAAIAARLPVDRLDTGRYFHVFEVIYPENRFPRGLSIVDYGDREDLVLISMRDRLTNQRLPYAEVVREARRVGLSHPEVFSGTLPEIFRRVDAAPRHLHAEGHIIHALADGKLYKLKYHGYQEVLRAVNEMRSNRFVREYVGMTHEARRDILGLLPPDIREVALGQIRRLDEMVAAVTAFAAAVTRVAPAGRREFAEFVKSHVPPEFQEVVFQRHKGRVTERTLEKVALLVYSGKVPLPDAPPAANVAPPPAELGPGPTGERSSDPTADERTN